MTGVPEGITTVIVRYETTPDGVVYATPEQAEAMCSGTWVPL
jgi:hypothetical protein